MRKKITKLMAVNAAIEMTKLYLSDDLDKARKELSNYATNVAYALIPKEVLDVSQKFKNYIQGSKSIGFFSYTGNSRLTTIYSETACIIPSGSHLLEVDNETYKKLANLRNKVTKIENEKSKFREEIKNALYSLGTKDRIEKTFPKAIKYINFGDDDKKSLPVSNYTKLQQIITKL